MKSNKHSIKIYLGICNNSNTFQNILVKYFSKINNNNNVITNSNLPSKNDSENKTSLQKLRTDNKIDATVTEKNNIIFKEKVQSLIINKSENLENANSIISETAEQARKKINEKIVSKLIANNKLNSNNCTETNSNIQIIENNSNELISGNFLADKKQAFNFASNKSAEDLILNKKIDFDKINFSSSKLNEELNLGSEITNSEINKEILEADFGVISAADIPSNLLKKENITVDTNDENYYYKVKLVGKEIDENSKINEYSMNQDDYDDNKKNDYNVNLGYYKVNQIKDEINYTNTATSSNSEQNFNNTNLTTKLDYEHFISPVIFKDSESSNQGNSNFYTVKEGNTILTTILSNPIIIVILIGVGYYIYPKIWNKQDYSNLNLHRNNIKIQQCLLSTINNYQNEKNALKYDFPNKMLYDYINYRRGLYLNVRSNFG